MGHTLTLTGYLGKDPEIRETKERTLTRKTRPEPLIFEFGGVRTPDRPCDICEDAAEYDVTVPSREYALKDLDIRAFIDNGDLSIDRWEATYSGGSLSGPPCWGPPCPGC